MAGDWLPSPIDEPRSRPILAIARRTGRSRHEVYGLWFEFKGWASKETVDGLLERLTLADLVEIVGGDEAFWTAVAAEGLLEDRSEGLFIPDASAWLSTGSKARLLKNMRQARWRDGKKREPDPVDSDVDAEAPTRTSTTEQNRTEQDREDETRRDDHEFSWTQETREHVREFCSRKFSRGPSPVFPSPIREDDRALLLKLGALYVAGKLPESIIDSGLEAIRQYSGAEPIGNRGAYLTRVLQDACHGRGIHLNQLLAKMRLPADLLKRRSPQPT